MDNRELKHRHFIPKRYFHVKRLGMLAASLCYKVGSRYLLKCIRRPNNVLIPSLCSIFTCLWSPVSLPGVLSWTESGKLAYSVLNDISFTDQMQLEPRPAFAFTGLFKSAYETGRSYKFSMVVNGWMVFNGWICEFQQSANEAHCLVNLMQWHLL